MIDGGVIFSHMILRYCRGILYSWIRLFNAKGYSYSWIWLGRRTSGWCMPALFRYCLKVGWIRLCEYTNVDEICRWIVTWRLLYQKTDTNHFSPFFGVEVFHDLVSNWNYGQSTYPHVRYTHEKLSLNKTILREQQRLITPCNTQRHFSLSVTSHIDVVFRFQPWHCVCEGFPGWEAPQVEIKR